VPDLLPRLVTAVPGPASRALAENLGRCECPDTTYLAADFPVFWERADGCNVWDADGNRLVDLTAAFGVCTLGHAHPAQRGALARQAEALVHAMGDVHPAAPKVRLAEELARSAPGDLDVCLFGGSGSDAVEAALKTAALATGRPGAVAFEGGYHGLGYGALALTWRSHFRAPFAAQLNPHVVHLPFPGRARPSGTGAPWDADEVLDRLDAFLAGADAESVGAVCVEPIQGRGGIVVPGPRFLQGLREICSRRGRLLVVDEILTGLGRTGTWFACDAAGVVPDLLCLGKSLAGGLPLSVCIGSARVMAAWKRSRGEARHTQTFLGNPLACAVALATLEVLRAEDWPRRVAARGAAIGRDLESLRGAPGVASVRGCGLMWGIVLVTAQGQPDGARGGAIARAALQRGYVLLTAGDEGEVLELLPPFVLGEAQWQGALRVLQELLGTLPPGA
jgi:4-aminobutyrate aminotransferase-like enzyme